MPATSWSKQAQKILQELQEEHLLSHRSREEVASYFRDVADKARQSEVGEDIRDDDLLAPFLRPGGLPTEHEHPPGLCTRLPAIGPG